jgi:hypothetical protein
MIQVNIGNVEAFGNIVRVSGELVATGNYVAGGDIADFTAAAETAAFQGLQPNIPSSYAPGNMKVFSENGNIGYQYVWIKGTTQANGKLKINGITTWGTELLAGAYPAAILADTIAFECHFRKFQ